MNESEQLAMAAPEVAMADDVREPQKFLIVGLGNPGREHKNTRHNIGFMTIDKLAEEWHISLGKVQQRLHRCQSGQLFGQHLVFCGQ